MDEPVPLQEGAASVPVAGHIEVEPPDWQPRALWLGARLLAGAAAFFWLSFVFAYFYLKSLDVAKKWTIGHISPPLGWGIAIIAVLVLSAVLLRLAIVRPLLGRLLTQGAVGLALISVVLQCIEYTTLKFGPASGGYGSVFSGWTALYAVFTLVTAYWIQVQAASLWRRRREGAAWDARLGIPTAAVEPLTVAGLEACSFFWGFFVFVGFTAFILLYVIGP
jgi:heme/copper-type cytochrome/quinol oxidase subunit 3